MTFYQELQLNQAGSKNLLKKSETLKEKLYHMWVYLVKIAVTMAFCFLFVTIFSILFGNENSIVGVVVLLCLMVFRNADLGIHTGRTHRDRRAGSGSRRRSSGSLKEKVTEIRYKNKRQESTYQRSAGYEE